MGTKLVSMVWAAALTWPAAPRTPADCARDAACVERLAALGRAWAAARYFHPWLAWREVDWDGALVAAVPRVIEARDASQYGAAVQQMLGALNDPVTCVLARAETPPPGPATLARATADGILVITLNPATLPQGREEVAPLAAALREWPRAKAVVFDLRGHQLWHARSPAIIGVLFQTSGLNQLLQFAPLRAPAHRSRMYSGLPPTAPGGSLFYHAAWYVRDGTLLEARSSRPKPVVFLADQSSLLPPIAPALQYAGYARIVAQGGISEAGLVERHRLSLADGLEAFLRTSELVYEDGSTGLTPDLTLPAAAHGEALDAALELAREHAGAPRPQREKVPMWTAPRAENAYAQNEYPPVALRLLAAFRLWAAGRYFFAYRHLMTSDWDRVLSETIPRLLEADDAQQYALAIAAMAAHLGDTHAAVTGRALAEYFGTAAPPVRTRMVEGKPVLWRLLDDRAARETGLAPGDLVLAVDGEPAGERMRRLARYLSASTPHSLDALLMERWLDGPPGTSAELTVRDAAGRTRSVRLARRNPARRPPPWRAGPVWTLLAGGVGYVDLERLAPQKVEEMFQALHAARAIVFDLRGYPQGTGWLIAPRLAGRPGIVAACFRRPLVLFPEGRAGDVETRGASWEFCQHLPGSGDGKFYGRVVALIDERTLSQAEHAALFLRAAGARLVGGASAGANGDVARIALPGGLLVSFSGQEVLLPDGSQLQRIGLRPEVEVRPTVEGVRAGRDEVLEKALELLGVESARVRGVGEAR